MPEQQGKEEVLIADMQRLIHLFVIKEIGEQERMAQGKPRQKSYPEYLKETAVAIIESVRHA